MEEFRNSNGHGWPGPDRGVGGQVRSNHSYSEQGIGPESNPEGAEPASNLRARFRGHEKDVGDGVVGG